VNRQVLPEHLTAGVFERRLRASVRLLESLRKLISAAEQVHLTHLLTDLKATTHISRAFGPLRSFPQKAAAGIFSPEHCKARPHWDQVALACRRRCGEFCLG